MSNCSSPPPPHPRATLVLITKSERMHRVPQRRPSTCLRPKRRRCLYKTVSTWVSNLNRQSSLKARHSTSNCLPDAEWLWSQCGRPTPSTSSLEHPPSRPPEQAPRDPTMLGPSARTPALRWKRWLPPSSRRFKSRRDFPRRVAVANRADFGRAPTSLDLGPKSTS